MKNFIKIIYNAIDRTKSADILVVLNKILQDKFFDFLAKNWNLTYLMFPKNLFKKFIKQKCAYNRARWITYTLIIGQALLKIDFFE